MIIASVKDHKGNDRSITIISGFKNERGTICASICTDKGEIMRGIRIHADGISQCSHPQRYGGQCYHVQAILSVANRFGADGLLDKPVELEKKQPVLTYKHADLSATGTLNGNRKPDWMMR
jgi:hypothetical protein